MGAQVVLRHFLLFVPSNLLFNMVMKKKVRVLVDRAKSGKFQKVNYDAKVTIGGKKYDKAMITAADTAIKGDGVISENDVKLIAKAIRPGGMGKKGGKDKAKGNATYDAGEKATMAYIRKKYKMTDKAKAALDKFIRHEAGQQAAKTKKKAMKAKAMKAKAMKAVVKKAMKK